MLFGIYGEKGRCDWIGVDIGSTHLGIVGLKGNYEDVEHPPKLAWVCLMSVPAKAIHYSCDKIDTLLVTGNDFGWVRNATHFRIEQQLPQNPGAKQIACSMRTCLRTMQMAKNVPPDVEFVSGKSKYDVAPHYSAAAQEDPLRSECLTGAKNGLKRKKLGENDCKLILKHQKEKNALRVLKVCKKKLDKIFDITDAYLIARFDYDKKTSLVAKKTNRKQK